MRHNLDRNGALLLLFGMFAQTRIIIIGSIGISELVCFLVAPFVFLSNFRLLKHDGFITYFCLASLTSIGCVLSSVYNQTPFPLFIRGFATTYSLFAYPVVLHKLLRNNLRGLRWYLLGLCISLIINTFVFQQADDLRNYESGLGSTVTEAVMNGPLFWISRLGSWMLLPVNGWYMSTPLIYSIIAPIPMVVYTLLNSGSGRSSAVIAVCTIAIIAYCRKKVDRIYKIQRRLVFFLIIGVVMLSCVKTGYTYAASSGMLGEKSQSKYEAQSKYGTDALGLLMGGRTQMFVGLLACCDRPFVGYGPWALDTQDYWGKFINAYGTPEDIAIYNQQLMDQMRRGGRVNLLPAHSMIVGFWLWYGALALPFWFYIIFLLYKLFKSYLAAIPQWIGYFAINAFSFAWGVLFSPFGNRAESCLILTCLLIARAVANGRIQLPYDMVREIDIYNRNWVAD